jgi:tetratricopeptide (TPR) repeat protein
VPGQRTRWRSAPIAIALGTTALIAACVVSTVEASTTCDPSAPLGDRAATQGRASACYAAHRVDAAVAIERKWLEANPGDAAMRVELARLLTETRDLAGAEREYDRVLQTGSVDASVRKAHADVLAWSGKLDAAVAEYRAVLASDPADSGAALGLGLALKWQGHPGEAEDALRDAVADDPGNAEAARQLTALLDSPGYRAWRTDADRLADPDDAARWVAAVDAYTAAEAYSEAESRLTAALARWPKDPRLASRRAALQREQDERAAARLVVVRTTLAADPEDTAARLEMAGLLADRREFSAATEAYTEYLRRRPEDLAARRQLARVLSWNGDYARALEEYDRLLALAPNDTDLVLERARVLAWDGQLTESADAFATVRSRDPAAAERGLGDAYRWGGQRNAAAVHYRAAMMLGDGNEHALAGESYFASESGGEAAAPRFDAVHDSDDFTGLHVGLETRQRLGVGTELAGGFSHAEYSQTGDHLAADRLRLTLAHDFDEHWRGAVSYSPALFGDQGGDSSDPTTTHNWSATIDRVVGPESTISLGYDRYDLIDEVLTVRSAQHHVLYGDRVHLTARHVLPHRIELTGSASWSDYSDGNALTALKASIGRRILRPGLSLRYEIGYLSTAQRSDLYWDPARYWTQGAVLAFTRPIAPHLRIALEARVGYGDDDGTHSLERAFGGKLEIVEIAGLTAELGYHYGETGRASLDGGPSGYHAHTGSLSVSYRFGTT